MRYLALATDYDGTLAHDGAVEETTRKSLARLRQSGRKIILVTGRELPDLERAFAPLDLFDAVVAENGGLLYFPGAREKRLLAPPASAAFVSDLKHRGVEGLSVGETIVATWHPYEGVVLDSIRALGLDLQVIFNKEAVMVLPSGVNKKSGLACALEAMKLSHHNVAGVGDAQNDLAFLEWCECSIAVENALPALKERVDWVTRQARGAGVAELIDKLMADDLSSIALSPEHHGIRLGEADGQPVYFAPHGKNLLLCGQSGSGKSTFVAGIVERLLERGYQTCLIDPEGDYEALNGFFTVGDEQHPPALAQVLQLLERADSNVAVNLIGVKMHDRPSFFATLLAQLQQKFLGEARPHWLIVDEAHHLLPSEWAPASAEMAADRPSLLLVTVHPEHVSPAALQIVDALAVVGKSPATAVEEFARLTGKKAPEMPAGDLSQGEAFMWCVDTGSVIGRMLAETGTAERKRHKRKYSEGELEQERLFWFRGPGNKNNLRVQNLNTFVQIAEGIDDETWLFHLGRGDYSKWMAEAIKDKDLAEQVRQTEGDAPLLPAGESRDRIVQAIRDRYTA